MPAYHTDSTLVPLIIKGDNIDMTLTKELK